MAASAGKIIKTLGKMKEQRATIDQTKRSCYDYVYPIRGAGYGSGSNTRSPGSDLSQANSKKAEIYDSTATDASKTLASFIISGIAPSNTRSFDLEIDGIDSKLPWLDESANTTWKEIHAGNFDSTGFDGILDLVVGGDSVLFLDYVDEELHFEQWESASCYLDSSRKGGLVDIIYREYTLTKEQAIKYFDGETLPVDITLAEQDKKLNFVHAIYPREKGKKGALKSSLPFASCHVFLDTKIVIKESGYEEFPCAVPRWSVIPNSPYAVGPVYEALPTIKSLNLASKYVLQNGELAISGMWGAVDDGVLNPGSIQIGPRKVVTMASPENFFPLNPGGNFQISEVLISNMQAEVRRLLMVDRIQMPDKTDTTAYEISVRMDILRQILGPLFGRLQTEFWAVIIIRAFGLLLRNNRFGEMPQELENVNGIRVRYINPLARAQRNIEVNAIVQFEQSLAQSLAIDPQAVDVYDVEEGQREKANLMGVPDKLMRNKTDIKKIREARAQAQQQAQAMQPQQAA